MSASPFAKALGQTERLIDDLFDDPQVPGSHGFDHVFLVVASGWDVPSKTSLKAYLT